MNITYSSYMGSVPDKEQVSTFATYGLKDQWSDGEIETLKGTTYNALEAFGRLVETLATKGLLTAPEVFHIVKGYSDEDATFTP